jgi:hypothetical protein
MTAKPSRRDAMLKAFMEQHERPGVGLAPFLGGPCAHESHKAVWLAAYRRAIEDAAAQHELVHLEPEATYGIIVHRDPQAVVIEFRDLIRALAPEQDDE